MSAASFANGPRVAVSNTAIHDDSSVSATVGGSAAVSGNADGTLTPIPLPSVAQTQGAAPVAAAAAAAAAPVAAAAAPVAAASTDSDSDIEFLHIVRRSKTKDEREKAKGGKAGDQGRFSADQNAFFEEFRQRYDDIREMTLGKNKALRAFWYDVRVAFWTRFTWRDVKDAWGEAAEGWSKAQCMRAANDVSKTAIFLFANELIVSEYENVV